jgi:hypothetical protein
MRTLSSIMRKVLMRAKGRTGTRVTQQSVKGPGVKAFNRPKGTRG